MNAKGTAVDGGGHPSEGECGKQATAMNAQRDDSAELNIRGYQFEDATFRSYPVEPASWKDEDRGFDAVLATEKPVVVMDMKNKRIVREVLRMDGLVMPAGGRLPLQDSHMRGSVRNTLGSTRNLHVENGQLVGRNFISSVEANVATKVREGHLTDLSLGYVVQDREMIEPGMEREIAGVTYRAEGSLPLQVSTRWAPRENSLTPIGADEAAKVRSSMWALVEVAPMAEEKKAAEKPAEKPTETPKAEPVNTETPVVKAEPARRDLLAEITPRGWDALLDAAVIEGLDQDGYRVKLREELAKRQQPVGTPEPIEPKAKDGLKNVSDEQFKRAF